MPAGLTLEEFLVWEFGQQTKHEFVDGRVIAFAGGTNRHNWIAMLLGSLILPHARPCLTLELRDPQLQDTSAQQTLIAAQAGLRRSLAALRVAAGLQEGQP
jgi:hypothetical protein